MELSSEELSSVELSSVELSSVELSSVELSSVELSVIELPVDEEFSLLEKHDAAPSDTAAIVSTLNIVNKTFLVFFMKNLLVYKYTIILPRFPKIVNRFSKNTPRKRGAPSCTQEGAYSLYLPYSSLFPEFPRKIPKKSLSDLSEVPPPLPLEGFLLRFTGFLS